MRPFEAVRHGFRAVRRSKRLVALVALVDTLICLAPALYVGRAVFQSVGYHVDATAVAKAPDMDFFGDLRAQTGGGLDDNLTILVVGSLLVFFVVRPLIMGGYVGIAAERRRLLFAEFVREGGALYWKFFRLALVGLAAMYLLSLAARPLLEYIDELAERLQSETVVLNYRGTTELIVFAAYLAAATVLDYTRIGLRVRRQKGVFRELLRSLLFVLQHPLKVMGFAVFAFLLEVVVIAIAAQVFAAADGGYLITNAVIFVMLLVVVMLREAVRLFHLAGAWLIRAEEEGTEEDMQQAPAGERDLLANLPWSLE